MNKRLNLILIKKANGENEFPLKKYFFYFVVHGV